MAKFKVGDKVNCADYGNGVITKIITSVMPENPYYVVFESGIEIYLRADRLTLPVAREFILIRRDGAKTIAELRHDREIIKSGTAICNASDTFDFDTGAKLAFDRLMGREEPKPAPQPPRRFKVGDRVVINETGKIGEVSAISTEIPFGCNILVAHENGFHSGDGFNVSTAKKEHDGKCEWFYPNNLSPATAPEPPKFYTGKVVCVEWKGDVFRHTNAGRIAIITNGISDYDGWNRMSKPFESFSDFCSANMHGVFHEIKE